jgi:hypothetical protein
MSHAARKTNGVSARAKPVKRPPSAARSGRRSSTTRAAANHDHAAGTRRRHAVYEFRKQRPVQELEVGFLRPHARRGATSQEHPRQLAAHGALCPHEPSDQEVCAGLGVVEGKLRDVDGEGVIGDSGDERRHVVRAEHLACALACDQDLGDARLPVALGEYEVHVVPKPGDELGKRDVAIHSPHQGEAVFVGEQDTSRPGLSETPRVLAGLVDLEAVHVVFHDHHPDPATQEGRDQRF